jgi:2-polyprenyl-3-methyl-5-hydroxy-6-metoxy-1,4-benzoquinol methylase
MTYDEVISTLHSFFSSIPRLYPQPVADYRGRMISAESVANYLRSELLRFAEVATFLPKPPKDGAKPKPPKDGAKLLDVGMAYGFLPAAIQSRSAWKCEGLEIAENIPVYCSFARQQGIPVHAGKLGVSPVSLPDRSYHGILFSEVLEHLRLSPTAALKELNRLLVPGGYLVLTTPNFTRLTNLVKMAVGRNPLESFPDVMSENITEYLTHIREYTMDEILILLRKSGFQIVKSTYSGCMEQDRAHSWITQFVPRWRGNLFVLAQKPS